MGHLLGVAVEQRRVAPAVFADSSFCCLAPARMRHVGVHVRIETVSVRRLDVHVVGGSRSTSVIFTTDLMLLNPYFHGTTKRTGAPFCGGSCSPYKPVA